MRVNLLGNVNDHSIHLWLFTNENEAFGVSCLHYKYKISRIAVHKCGLLLHT